MSGLLHFPNPRLELEQATAWIVRLDRGLRGAERKELSIWLAASDRHREALLEAAGLWDRTDMLSELAELFPLREEVIERRSVMAWPAVAASVALVGLAVTVFMFQFQGSNRAALPGAELASTKSVSIGQQQGSPTFTQNYATAIGEQRSVDLPDHSRIMLNTNSALQIEFSATERLVKMTRGEANFKVAKDPARAFTVRVAGIDFTAVGTAFDIRADSPRGLRLTVTEGRVRVHHSLLSANDSVITSGMSALIDVEVEANKELVIDPATRSIDSLEQAQVAAATSWQRGMVVFQGTPLDQVVAEFARYSTTRIVIADPALGRIPVSGYFKLGDIDGLSVALKQNFDIDVQKNNDSIVLTAGP
jgi:transmembrane sensor